MNTCWWNFKLEKYQYLEIGTITDFQDYIPSNTHAQGLYQIHIARGLSPIQAAEKVLIAVISVHEKK